MDIILLLLGIGLAVSGAHYLVDGGSAIAKHYNIPTLVIGSTIVAFGTSMPEFTVNINSALNGNTDLALGNILGSNLFNICAVIGIVSLISPIVVGNDAATKDLPMALIAAAVVGISGNQIYFDHINYHELFMSNGLVMLFFFAIFMRYVYGEAARLTRCRKPSFMSLSGWQDWCSAVSSSLTGPAVLRRALVCRSGSSAWLSWARERLFRN
jgi:cation:H+ antiporter